MHHIHKLVIMRVSEAQFRSFIEKYLNEFRQLAPDVAEEDKLEIFPSFLVRPYEIIGIISRVHGAAIEFVEEAKERSLKIFEMDERIENVVLPQESTKNPAFVVKGRNFSIGSVGMYTKEFSEKYVRKAEGTVLVFQPPLKAFMQVSVGGDVIFHDVQFGGIVNENPSVKTIKGALWIFGSNSAKDFSLELAENRAVYDFRRYLSFAALGMLQFPAQEQIKLSLRTLPGKIKELRVLMTKQNLKERELQDFFEKNPEFLCLATYRRLFSQIVLETTDGKKLVPDFFLERVIDNYCDILDIKLPQKQVLTGTEERRRFTVEVYEAIAQVREYKDYFDEARNREEVTRKFGLQVYKPNIKVLIGSTANVEKKELIKIRAQHPDIEVITYDDILKQIEHLKDLLENSVVPQAVQ